MRNMKHYIALILLVVLTQSCDKRLDYWEENNLSPSVPVSSYLNFWSDDSTFTELLVDSLRNTEDYYLVFARWDDRIDHYKIMISEPSYGNLYYEGEEVIYDTYFDPGVDYGKFRYIPSGTGTDVITITAIDAYERIGKTTFSVLVFDNLPPVIDNITIENIANISPREYEIDVSNSRDLDQKFGGSIYQYEYVVGDDTIRTPNDIINYVFSEAGVYTLSARAQDNEFVWSDYVTLGGVIIE